MLTDIEDLGRKETDEVGDGAVGNDDLGVLGGARGDVYCISIGVSVVHPNALVKAQAASN